MTLLEVSLLVDICVWVAQPANKGRLLPCASGVVSGILALEAKSSGTGSTLKVSVQTK